MSQSLKAFTRPILVDSLRRQIRDVETERLRPDLPVIRTGCVSFDRLLPRQGFIPGTLTEWLSERSGGGAEVLSLMVAQRACQQGGKLVVFDSQNEFYPPAALAWGVSLDQLMIVRPRTQEDLLWSIDQALRCSSVSAVWGAIDGLDERSFRRFQLAAESSGCLGLFLRPASARGLPSWSEVQFWVRPLIQGSHALPTHAPSQVASTSARSARGDTSTSPLFLSQAAYERHLHVHLLRCRGGTDGRGVTLKIDESAGAIHEVITNHETHPVSLAAQLANPKISRRAARA